MLSAHTPLQLCFLIARAFVAIPTMSGIQQVPHTQCGLHLVMIGNGVKQTLVNALTGDSVDIVRTDEMITANAYYDIGYDAGGFAYLSNGAAQIWVSSMGFTKVAVQNTAGRIAIQDKAARAVHWLEEYTREKKTHTVTINKKGIVVTRWAIDRQFTQSRPSLPHRVGGQVMWEMRGLKAQLEIDYGDDELHSNWCRHNFKRGQAYWDVLFANSDGVHSSSHWLPSERSWVEKKKVIVVVSHKCYFLFWFDALMQSLVGSHVNFDFPQTKFQAIS